jgi:hypothetical protein
MAGAMDVEAMDVEAMDVEAMDVEAMEVRTKSAWSMGFTRRLPCWERWPGRW